MGVHRITNENEGVRIQYQGLPPGFIVRNLFAIFFFLISALTITLVFAQLTPKLSDDWYMRLDWLWRIAVYLLIFLGTLILILYSAARIISSMYGYWKLISVASGDERLIARNAGWWGFGKSRLDCNLSRLVMIDATVGPENNGPLEISLSFCLLEAPSYDVQFAVEDVNLRREAIDLLFTLGRAAGLTHYAIDQNNVECLGANLTRFPDGDAWELIPEATQVPRYDLDQTSTDIPVTKPNISKLDVNQFKATTTKIVEWKPGNLIRFVRSSASWIQLLIVGISAGLLAGCIYLFGATDRPFEDRILPAAFAFLIVAFISSLLYRLINCHRVVNLNWNTNLLRWRTGWFSNSARLQDISGLTLKGAKQTSSQNHGTRRTHYHCKLALQLSSGKRVHLIGNDHWSQNSTAQRKKLEPLAAALSDVLSVPWNWVDFDEAPRQKFFANFFIGCVLTGIVGALGFLIYGMWYQFQSDSDYGALAESLRSSGVEIQTNADVYVGNQNIIGNGWVVKATGPEYSDADLAALLEKRSEFPLYGLNLSDSGVTDDGIKLLAGENGPFFLDLRGTGISAAAMPALAQTRISYLDVRNTEIRLEDLTHFEQFFAINAIYISDDEISESDKRLLKRVPYLEYILVNNEEDTRELLREINDGSSISTLKVAPPPRLENP